MDELTIADKKYLSSKRAAQITGYAKDYVGQLCREGRVDARLVGRNWYVLESSILEHRFGPNEVNKAELVTSTELDATWKTPVYTSESARIVPEVLQKAVYAEPLPIQDNQKVLADMQSAWQEWFSGQNQAELTLPDAAEMLLEPGDSDIEGQTADTEPEIESEGGSSAHVRNDEVEEPTSIHISKIVHSETEELAPTTFEEITPQRKIENRETLELGRHRSSSPITPRKASTSRRRTRGTFVLQAIFISIAGLAVAVAAIGSGMMERFVHERTISNPVSDYLQGVTTVETSK